MRWLVGLSLVLAVLFAGPEAHGKPRKWRFSGPHTAAHFSVKHLLIATVRGTFSHVVGTAFIDDDDITRSRVTAEIYVGSLYSGSWKRDEILKSKLFFDAGSFPRMFFRSTKVARAPQGHLLVTGILTIRDRAREITLEVQGPMPAVRDPSGRLVRAIVARTRFDRKAFGMTWQKRLDGGGVVLSDEVDVELDVELIAMEPSDMLAAGGSEPQAKSEKPSPRTD